MTYLDTHVVAALDRRELDTLTARARKVIEAEADIRISPMVLLELEFLQEIGRIKGKPEDIVADLRAAIGLNVCNRSFVDVARRASEEHWTRDPFDRLIVAQARLTDAVLITRDQLIQANYKRALG